MRYLLVVMLVVSLFVSACAAKLPEDVDHPCPNGTELMVRNLGDYMIGHQTIDGTCVVERGMERTMSPDWSVSTMRRPVRFWQRSSTTRTATS